MSVGHTRRGDEKGARALRGGRHFAAVVSALTALALLLGRTAAAEPSRPSQGSHKATAEDEEHIKQAKVLNEEAEELYTHGQYRAAIAKLNAALKLDPDGKVLVYDLAIAHERLAEFEMAEKYYRRYLEMETDPKVVERVQSTLKRIEGAKKEIPPPPPAPPVPPPPRRTMSRWVFPATTVATTALGVGLMLGLSALVTAPGSNPTTGPGVSVDDLHANATLARREAFFADVCFAISAAAGGAALYFYLASPAPEPVPAQPQRAGRSVVVGIGPARAYLQVLF